MRRRTFSAALIAPMLPASAGKIGVAVIGTGHGHAISKIRALRGMSEYDLAGVCAHSGEPAESDALRGLKWLPLKHVLDDPAIELVAIESADIDRNLDYAEQCVQAGKFVHLDQPPGRDGWDASIASAPPSTSSSSPRSAAFWPGFAAA